MFSKHGNMAFHQGDINIDINSFPKPTKPASFSVGKSVDSTVFVRTN